MDTRVRIKIRTASFFRKFYRIPKPVQLTLFAGLFAFVGGLYLWNTRAATIYNIPASIASDCSKDVTAELNNWFRSIPDGTNSSPSVLMFGSSKCYRVDGKLINLDSYNPGERFYKYLVFDGNGSRLDGTYFKPPTDAKINHDMVYLVDAVGITFQNFSLYGQHTNPCNLDASGNCRDGGAIGQYEWYSGIAIGGGQDINVRNVKIYNMYGDGILLHGGHGAGNRDSNGQPLWANATPKNITIENTLIDGTGRHAIGMVAGDGVLVKGSTFDRISYQVVDLEYEAFQPVRNITFDGNTIKRHYLGFIAATTGGEYGVCPPEGFNSNHVFINNVMTVSGVTTTMPIWENATQDSCVSDKKDIRIENNTLIYQHGSDQNPVIKLQRVLGTISIKNNRFIQADPLKAYTAVGIWNSTPNVTIRSNDGREAAYAYMVDGFKHKSGVDACGNITALGTNIPIACSSSPPPADTNPPSAPVNLRATSITSNSVVLAWDGSTDDVGVMSYDVYRDGVVVGNVSSTTNTAYTDNGLLASKVHSYYVTAKDAAGNESKASNVIDAQTIAEASSTKTAITSFNGTIANYGSNIHTFNLPKSGTVALDLSWAQGAKFTIEVIDANDRIVLRQNAESSPLRASFSAPSAGEYTFRVTLNMKPSRKYTLKITYPL